MQQVILAHRIVTNNGKPLKGGGVFEQLTQMAAGQRETIVTSDGVASKTPFTVRLLRAFDSYRSEHNAGY